MNSSALSQRRRSTITLRAQGKTPPNPEGNLEKSQEDLVKVLRTRSGVRVTRLRHRLAESLAFGARMGLVIDLRQVLEIEVRVDLGRGNAGMAKHLLHGAQVAGRLQDMRGK